MTGSGGVKCSKLMAQQIVLGGSRIMNQDLIMSPVLYLLCLVKGLVVIRSQRYNLDRRGRDTEELVPPKKLPPPKKKSHEGAQLAWLSD